MKKSTRESERVRMVRQLWLERYSEGERTGHHVLLFNGWLGQNRTELLNRRYGDSYQQLKSDLRGPFGEIEAPKQTPRFLPKFCPTVSHSTQPDLTETPTEIAKYLQTKQSESLGGKRNWFLSLVRLPIPPLSQCERGQ
jgi:hypothetical protein